MQEFHCEGIWWLPTAASDTVGGTLTFSHTSGLTLSLFGVLGESTGFTTEKVAPIILGIAWDCPVGQLLTLTNCRQSNFSMGFPGINREAYHCERLFAGAHLEQEEEFLFSRAVVEFSSLSSWADCLTGFIRSNEGDTRKVGLEWDSPEVISGLVPGGSVSLFVEATRSWARRKSSIEEVVRFSIECNEPISAEEIDKAYVYPLQNFLPLATDRPNALVEFSVSQSNKRNPINLIYSMVYQEPLLETLLP